MTKPLFDYETLLKLYIRDERKEAFEEGLKEGLETGQKSLLFKLVRNGSLSARDAADYIHLTETAFLDQMDSYFQKTQADT